MDGGEKKNEISGTQRGDKQREVQQQPCLIKTEAEKICFISHMHTEYSEFCSVHLTI